MHERRRHLTQRTRQRPGVSRWRRLVVILALALPLVAQAQSEPGGVNRAGVVVRGIDGQVRTACVSFTEPTIGGLALLERSGFDVNTQVSGSNATVCSIDGAGCSFPQDKCFCQCQGGGACRFWNYWHLVGGAWQFAATGAPVYRVKPGGVDGWSWGGGGDEDGSRPPALSFAEICPLPEAAVSAAVTMLPTITEPGSALQTSTAGSRSTAATPDRPATRSTGPSIDLGQYALFGVTVGGLVVAVGLAARRRR